MWDHLFNSVSSEFVWNTQKSVWRYSSTKGAQWVHLHLLWIVGLNSIPRSPVYKQWTSLICSCRAPFRDAGTCVPNHTWWLSPLWSAVTNRQADPGMQFINCMQTIGITQIGLLPDCSLRLVYAWPKWRTICHQCLKKSFIKPQPTDVTWKQRKKIPLHLYLLL